MKGFLTQMTQYIWAYIPSIVLAIVTLVVGFWAIKQIVKVLVKALSKNEDVTLNNFLESVVSMLLKIVLVVSVASTLGIETTSIVAVLGAASFAVGLALQGSLSNFAGGVLLILFKPFKAGDVIEAQGFTGKVHEVQILNTILKTPDNKTIIIPNGQLANGNIVNYSTEPQRRVDMLFGIGYGDDIDKAKEVIRGLIAQDTRVLKAEGKEPFIAVSELADSSVNIAVRMWCYAENYWGIFFDMQEKVKLGFDKEGVSIPYPHQEVYMHQVEKD